MLATVTSCAVIGLEGALIEVQVDTSRGLPSWTLVGLPDAAVRESGERVRAAIKNSGLKNPDARLTVNLAPADLRKEGPAFDLPIAVGVLIASDQLFPLDEDARHGGAIKGGAMIVGELSLDGSVRHVKGVLPMAATARDAGLRSIYVPEADAPEAALVPELTVYPVSTLGRLVSHLLQIAPIEPYRSETHFNPDEVPPYATDFSEIKGQEHVKRAMEVAAAGGHNILLSGPPGAGKTLIARAVPGILPRLTLEEALEVTRIYSVADMIAQSGAGREMPLIRQRPFRAPHHTISHAGLVGGGHWPRPGEISLAHRGVLFLDELPEFGTRNLETLRQPVEDRVVTISRATGALTFPANFMLIAAMNPCPCGYYGDSERECTCSQQMITRYQKRISGPMMDRIDIHADVPRVDYDKLTSDRLGETSEAVRARVEAAREVQRVRFEGTQGTTVPDGRRLTCNADMGPAEVRQFCEVEAAGKALLRAAMQQLHMSARAYHRILKLSRTIADLAGSATIQTAHLAEAIQYRPRRQF